MFKVFVSICTRGAVESMIHLSILQHDQCCARPSNATFLICDIQGHSSLHTHKCIVWRKRDRKLGHIFKVLLDILAKIRKFSLRSQFVSLLSG